MKKIFFIILIPFLLGAGPIGIYESGVYDGKGIVIDATGYNQGIYVYGVENVVIKGYEVKNASQFCVQVENSKNVIVDGLNIHDCGEAGAFLYDGSNYKVINSTLINTGQFGARFADSQNVSAINNTVRNLKRFTDSRGLDFENVQSGNASLNTIYDIGDGHTDGAGIETFDSSDFTAAGNTIYNVRSGIESKAGTKDINFHFYLKNKINNVWYGIEYGSYPVDNGFRATGGFFGYNTIQAKDIGLHLQEPQEVGRNSIWAPTPVFIDMR